MHVQSYNELPSWPSIAPEFHLKGKLQYNVNDEINSKVIIWLNGDSTSLDCDAIVNAANSELLPGGGICGAIHSRAGPKMERECRKLGHTPTGTCKISRGYSLPAKYCIHAVGPIGEQPDLLRSAYQSVLNCIDGERISSIALCAISTGIYGYPVESATRIAMNTVREFLEDKDNLNKTDKIIFVVFNSAKHIESYSRLMPMYFPCKEHLEESLSVKLEKSQSEESQHEEPLPA